MSTPGSSPISAGSSPTSAVRVITIPWPVPVRTIPTDTEQKIYFKAIKKHIDGGKFGNGFNDAEIMTLAARATTLITHLGFQRKESAAYLALLTMYDLAILIDDSGSMLFEENGERIALLRQVMKVISHVYCPSQETGRIKAIRFLNNGPGLDNAFPEQLDDILRTHDYAGMTRIGTVLKEQILTPLVTETMTRPLLVMILTDGNVECENKGKLEEVIRECIQRLPADKKNFVAFQFSRIGDDAGAEKLLNYLDNLQDLGKYIDCQRADTSFQLVANPTESDQVKQITKLMIGAISAEWDDYDLDLAPM